MAPSSTHDKEPRPGRPAAAATPITYVPSEGEVDWRIERMSKLGASEDLALEVAESDVDVHEVERMLAAGCPLELAWYIRTPGPQPVLPEAVAAAVAKHSKKLARQDAAVAGASS